MPVPSKVAQWSLYAGVAVTFVAMLFSFRPGQGEAHQAVALYPPAPASPGPILTIEEEDVARRFVQIAAEPSGADVQINGKWIGKVPLSAEVALDGRTVIEIKAQGYHAITYTVPENAVEIPFFTLMRVAQP